MNLPFRTIGRYLFALTFLVFGVLHFMNAEAMAGMVPIPGGVIWIYITGVAHILAAVSIIIEKYTRLACLLLALMLLIFILSIHLPALLGGDMNAMSQLLKDMGLAGGALILGSLYGTTARP